MSLHQPSESVSTSRGTLIPASLIAAISLALAACDKQEAKSTAGTSPSQEEVVVAPSPPIDASTSAWLSSQILASEVVRLAIGSQNPHNTFQTHMFAPDLTKLDSWQVYQVDVGFGPGSGIHLVLAKQEKGGTSARWEMVDGYANGHLTFSELSISSPAPAQGGVAMMRTDKNYEIDEATMQMYTAALKTAKGMLEAQKSSPKQENK